MNINELKNIPGWNFKSYPSGMELSYCRIRSRAGRLLALIPFFMLLLGSWILCSLIENWIFSAVSVNYPKFLWMGSYFFIAGGFLIFGIVLLQNLTEETIYLITPQYLKIKVKKFWTNKHDLLIPKDQVLELRQISKQKTKVNIFKVLIIYNSNFNESENYLFEGLHEKEAQLLHKILNEWIGLKDR